MLTVFGSLGLVFQVIDRTFGLSPGFYWQTVETQECVCKGSDATLELHTEVSTLSFKSLLCNNDYSFLTAFFWTSDALTQLHDNKCGDTQFMFIFLLFFSQVSVALGCKAFFLHPSVTRYTLQLLLESGLDVCGLRLLYPPQGLLSNSAGTT